MRLADLLEYLQISILSFLNHLLLSDLVLLHLQAMQELVWLSEHLWDEGIVVELLDLPYLSFHLEVLGTGLVDVRKEILIFEIHSIVFSIIVFGWVVGGRFGHVML